MIVSPATLIFFTFALLLLAGLLVLLPLGLEALANRNKTRTKQLRRQLARQHADQQQLQNQLQPYTQLASGPYRRLSAKASDHLTPVTATLRRLANSRPALPTVPRLLWPAGHFLRQPHTAVAICRDWWQLRQANLALSAAQDQIWQAASCLQDLAALPASLRREAAALAARQQALSHEISKEQAIQPANLGDLAHRQKTLSAQTAEIQRQLAADALPASKADTLANWLDAIQSQHETVASTLADRQQQRQTFQQTRQATAGRLTTLRTALHPHQQIPLVPHLFQESAAALTTADQTAQQANWTHAAAALAAVSRWIALGELLLPPLTAVEQLSHLRPASRQPETIDHLQAVLNQQLHTLQTTLPDINRPESAWQTALTACQNTLDDITRQAEAQLAAEETDRQRQATNARQARRQLDRAWSTYQRQLRPAANDLLRQRHNTLQHRFASTADTPRAWFELATAASILIKDILATSDYITLRSRRIAEMRQALPDQVDEAEALSGPWYCLQPELNVVKETAVFLQQFPTQQRQVTQLADLHQLFDQAKHAWLNAEDALATLRLHGERLHSRLESIEATRQLLANLEDTPDGHTPRAAILHQVVDRHLDDAFRASRPEDAIHALEQAETYLQKLL